MARPNECEKYKLHVEETDKIASLLSGLASRLARAQRAVDLEPGDDKSSLQMKRDKLVEQMEEAKKLKANIDKRSKAVLEMLSKYVKAEVMADFQMFMANKARLIVESRDLQDKIANTQEQIALIKT